MLSDLKHLSKRMIFLINQLIKTQYVHLQKRKKKKKTILIN